MQAQVEQNLVRITQLARRYHVANEEILDLQKKLRKMESEYDTVKHTIKFENQKKRTVISTL